MIQMCAALGSPVLLACSSVSPHASADPEHIARDLRKPAMMALPFNLRVAFEGLSWGRHLNDCAGAWDVVHRADCPNLGLGIDSYHSFATGTPLQALDAVDPARHFRVFPGEGVHSDQLVRLVQRLHALGYRGDYSFEVFNDDYPKLPLGTVAERVRRSATWLAEDVLRRAVPLPGQHARVVR